MSNLDTRIEDGRLYMDYKPDKSEEKPRMAQVIKRTTPVEDFLKEVKTDGI